MNDEKDLAKMVEAVTGIPVESAPGSMTTHAYFRPDPAAELERLRVDKAMLYDALFAMVRASLPWSHLTTKAEWHALEDARQVLAEVKP